MVTRAQGIQRVGVSEWKFYQTQVRVHSEAERHQTTEFGEEEDLLQGCARAVWLMPPKKPQSIYRHSIFKGHTVGRGCRRVCDWLVHSSLIG